MIYNKYQDFRFQFTNVFHLINNLFALSECNDSVQSKKKIMFKKFFVPNLLDLYEQRYIESYHHSEI